MQPSMNQDTLGSQQQHSGAAVFQAAVYDRVAASANLRRSRQPSRLPEELQNRHRAFSILQSLTGLILGLLGFVALAWGESPSPLTSAVGVWCGPGFLLAGQLGCQAGRSGNGGRSRRVAVRWSMASLGGCLASIGIGLAAVVVRARRIDPPPAPVAASDCVNLGLVCFGLCMSVAQAAFAYLSVWHCLRGGVEAADLKTPAGSRPRAAAAAEIGGVFNVQQSVQQSVEVPCPACLNRQRAARLGAGEEHRQETPPPSYQQWRSMTLGAEQLLLTGADASPRPPQCQSMIDGKSRRNKNLRVHWKL